MTPNGESFANPVASDRSLLEAVCNKLSSALFVLDRHQRCTYMNPAAERLTGFSLAELRGKRLHDVVHHVHPDGTAYPIEDCPIAATLGGNTRRQGEEIWVRRDGSFQRVAFTASPIAGEATVQGTIVEVRDAGDDQEALGTRDRLQDEIRQRRQEIDQALRDSEERFRKVFEHSHDAIFVLDPERNAVLEVNPAGVRMFGYDSREELLATPLSNFHPDDLSSFLEFVRTVHKEGAGWTDEFACRAKPGHAIASEISASTIIVDNRPCLLAMVRDVSERKRAEQALRDSEALLRATYDNVQVGISEIDLDGRFQRVNEAFCRLLGYTREELTALNFADISHPDDVVPTRQAVDRLRAGDADSFQLDKRYIHKSGRAVWASLNATAVRDQAGRPLAFLGAIQDITERKEAEEHRQLLVGELNHRVRNTLATVQAIVSQTLRGAAVEPGLRENLEARVFALAKAHGLLTNENWKGAGLRDVMFKALQAFGLEEHRPGRIAVSGSDVRLKPKHAVALVMALHELAANAAKYGALSCDSGRVDVSWDFEQGSQGRQLRLTWREADGPPVAPPQRKGFGSHLIERGLAQELGGEVRLAYEPGGVVCHITMPHDEPS